MARIRVQNFGPIKEGCLDNEGWIDIKKATFFTGNQGSGKSTLAKLISTLLWIEKSEYRGDSPFESVFPEAFNLALSFHNIHNYFTNNTVIEFDGDFLKLIYNVKDKNGIIPTTIKKTDEYLLPKIMYVPSERNFLSTIKNAFNVEGLPKNLFTFAEEFRKAQRAYRNKTIELGISNHRYLFDFDKDESYIQGENYKINLTEASSGYQSFVPLLLVTKWLSDSLFNQNDKNITQYLKLDYIIAIEEGTNQIIKNAHLSEEEKRRRIEKLRSRFFVKNFINIIEEPEQNLFPSSQWEMLKELMYYANYQDQNKLIVTTHSPYLINFISIIAKAYSVYQLNLNKEQKERLQKIVPEPSVVHPEGISIYEFDEHNGTIKKLPDYKGIPSDDNYLNNGLGTANDLFVELLEIEEECQ